MNASNTNKQSETDWARVDRLTDEEIDTSDIPPLDESFFAKARLRMPKQISVTMQVDADVIEWYQAHGEKYESLINTALRSYAEEHKAQQR